MLYFKVFLLTDIWLGLTKKTRDNHTCVSSVIFYDYPQIIECYFKIYTRGIVSNCLVNCVLLLLFSDVHYGALSSDQSCVGLDHWSLISRGCNSFSRHCDNTVIFWFQGRELRWECKGNNSFNKSCFSGVDGVADACSPSWHVLDPVPRYYWRLWLWL